MNYLVAVVLMWSLILSPSSSISAATNELPSTQVSYTEIIDAWTKIVFPEQHVIYMVIQVKPFSLHTIKNDRVLFAKLLSLHVVLSTNLIVKQYILFIQPEAKKIVFFLDVEQRKAEQQEFEDPSYDDENPEKNT